MGDDKHLLKKLKKKSPQALSPLALLTLAACGGGGDESVGLSFSTNENATSLLIGSVLSGSETVASSTYALRGEDADRFELSSDGELSLKEPANYELQDSYEITIEVTTTKAAEVEGEEPTFTTATRDYTVNVVNVNDPATGALTVAGTPAQGETLTADTSAVSDEDGVGIVSYQWYRDGELITGEVSNELTLMQADVGSVISADISYVDGSGATETFESAATAAVSNTNDTPTGVPVISGTLSEDRELSVDTSGIADADGLGEFSYQWNRDGAAIEGATADTHTLSEADVGTNISVTVSYADGYGAAESVVSAETTDIAKANDAPTGSLVISGTAAEGETLTLDTSNIADVDGVGTFSYVWMKDGSVLAGETGSTYILTQADVGSVFSASVSYVDGLGVTETLNAEATAAVANVNDDPTGTLVISGTAEKGSILTLDSSSIADEDGLGEFSITWLSDDTPIAGATEATYTLTAADVGKSVSAQVSYSDLHGTDETVLSDSLFVARYDLSPLAHTVGGSTHIAGISSVVTEKYDGYPTQLNGEFDFTHLEIDYSKFTFSSFDGPQYSASTGYTGMVYYGNSGDLTGDGTPEMVLSGWTVNAGNASGRIFIVEFSDNQISNVAWRENEGTAAPWVEDFDGDGRAEILSVGFYDFPVAPAETVYFDENLDARTVIGPRIDSHESSVVDFDGDGDLDVVAISYNTVNGLISLYRNNGEGFDHEYLPKDFQGYYTAGSSIEYADFDGDGRGEFVIGDFAGNGADGGLAILKLAENNRASWDEGSEEVLTIRPYFENSDFDGINSLFTSLNPYATDAEIAKYRSHDIVLKAIDIDGDRDLDLINSTQIWHDLTPFGVLQILVNDGAGNFEDQTNSRLINYSLQSGGAHDLIFIDVNNDGFVDILNPEGGGHTSEYFDDGYAVDFAQLTEANSILLNDGTGHFLKIMTAPFSRPGTFSEDGYFYPNKWYPLMNEDGTLGFVQLDHAWTNYPNGEYDVINYAHLDQVLHTGPKFVNSAEFGTPGFNEFYVLRSNPEVQDLVKAGTYGSALEWYLETNPTGVYTFATGAQVVGSSDDDVIILREGSETAFGYAGNDVIHALGGDDTLTGGSGADTFFFVSVQSQANHNTVTDFILDDGDRLDLSGFGIDTVSEAMPLASETDSGTIISLSETASVTLLGVELSTLAIDQNWIA